MQTYSTLVIGRNPSIQLYLHLSQRTMLGVLPSTYILIQIDAVCIICALLDMCKDEKIGAFGIQEADLLLFRSFSCHNSPTLLYIKLLPLGAESRHFQPADPSKLVI